MEFRTKKMRIMVFFTYFVATIFCVRQYFGSLPVWFENYFYLLFA